MTWLPSWNKAFYSSSYHKVPMFL